MTVHACAPTARHWPAARTRDTRTRALPLLRIARCPTRCGAHAYSPHALSSYCHGPRPSLRHACPPALAPHVGCVQWVWRRACGSGWRCRRRSGRGRGGGRARDDARAEAAREDGVEGRWAGGGAGPAALERGAGGSPRVHARLLQVRVFVCVCAHACAQLHGLWLSCTQLVLRSMPLPSC